MNECGLPSIFSGEGPASVYTRALVKDGYFTWTYFIPRRWLLSAFEGMSFGQGGWDSHEHWLCSSTNICTQVTENTAQKIASVVVRTTSWQNSMMEASSLISSERCCSSWHRLHNIFSPRISGNGILKKGSPKAFLLHASGHVFLPKEDASAKTFFLANFCPVSLPICLTDFFPAHVDLSFLLQGSARCWSSTKLNRIHFLVFEVCSLY